MSWLIAFFLGWLVWHLMDRSAAEKDQAKKPKNLHYRFHHLRNRALALAHPVAMARLPFGFADPMARLAPDNPLQTLRPALLHVFGLRNGMEDAQIRIALRERLNLHWYQIDLDAPRPQDDPRDALAFACARVTFAVRCAAMLGWIDEETQWHVLHQNAQRAKECFESWSDYGAAWARGRQQWVSNSRADSLGVAFGEQQVKQWAGDRGHPWGQWPW